MNPEQNQGQKPPEQQQQIIELAKGGITDANLTAEEMNRLLNRGVPFRRFVKELAQTFGRPEEELRQQQQPPIEVKANPNNMGSYGELHHDVYNPVANDKMTGCMAFLVIAVLALFTIAVAQTFKSPANNKPTISAVSPTPVAESASSTNIVEKRTFQSRVRFRNQLDDNLSMVEITAQWQVPASLPIVEQKNIARKIEMTATAATTIIAIEYVSGGDHISLINQAIKYEFLKKWRKIVKLQPQSPLANCQPIITDVRVK